ncbi:CRTAC1 family protein [soil metagenome]
MKVTSRIVASLLVTIVPWPGVAAAAEAGAGRLAPVAVPLFVDETASAGVEQIYDGEWEFFVGGGVAVFDCDADGRPDLYIAGGVNPAGLFRNESPVGGALRFARMTDPATDLERVMGAYPLDIDGDGLTDLAVLRHGENALLRGLGECRFERANEAWGFDGGEASTTAFSATWEEGAEWPTLAIGNYVTPRESDGTTSCFDNMLLRPNAKSSGYGPPLALDPSWCALSMLFSDWNRSGRRDLRVTNDRHYYRDGEDQLWRIAPGQAPQAYTREDGWERVRIWGMGIASQDITGDGYPEVYLTSIGDNRLQTLADGPERPSFRDIAFKRQVTAHRPFAGGDGTSSTAWHPEFDDVNNDGRMDLYISKGNVEAMAENAMDDPNNLLLSLPDGTFADAAVEAGILNPARTRGAAVVDLNLDGLLDLVEVNRRENVSLRRNLGAGEGSDARPMGHWLAIDLEQEGANRDAVGAWIEVRSGRRTTSREVTVGGGHAGGQLGPTHFGVGDARRARVRVRWPDGERGPWLTVPSDQYVTVIRGADAVRPWSVTHP